MNMIIDANKNRTHNINIDSIDYNDILLITSASINESEYLSNIKKKGGVLQKHSGDGTIME